MIGDLEFGEQADTEMCIKRERVISTRSSVKAVIILNEGLSFLKVQTS